ncbi:hypothetical protein HQ51_0208840 [Bacillus altitudinis]|nr:hypothetical protein CFN77_11885 [Bacillus altitudinis]MBW3700446.1 hypothetical protein [Bacillus aerophilus]HCO79127.1 hypothetical protein [Bacillus sp. (in: firmicutes)]KLV24649.1 hypothetical protein ABW03_02930 [Bacillus altitudinis]KWZ66578.1 hypothetical protein HQ51_0208840 [Bacillus altitudinis]
MKTLPAVKIKEDGSDEKKLWNKEGVLMYTVRQRTCFYRGEGDFSSHDQTIWIRMQVECIEK